LEGNTRALLPGLYLELCVSDCDTGSLFKSMVVLKIYSDFGSQVDLEIYSDFGSQTINNSYGYKTKYLTRIYLNRVMKK